LSKVCLPKEVAEDIEEIRRLRNNSYLLDTRNFLGQKSCVNIPYEYEGGKIAAYLADDIDNNFAVYASAIINGYVVEKSPEENIRDYYAAINRKIAEKQDAYDHGVRDGIKYTVAILGITVEGVND